MKKNATSGIDPMTLPAGDGSPKHGHNGPGNLEHPRRAVADHDPLPAAEGNVRIRFLGSGDNFGSGGRFQTCIHVNAGKSRFLIDCGASSLIPMKRAGIRSDGIDIILISHLHGDHFGGIPFFILDAQLISRREIPLVIAGPPGLTQRVREAMEIFYPGSSGIERNFAIEYVEMTEGENRRMGDLAVLPLRVIHGSGAPSYALRVECAGKIIAYSGDTPYLHTVTEVVLLREEGRTVEARRRNARYVEQTGDERLTLVTCHPYGSLRYRLIVVAHPGIHPTGLITRRAPSED